MGDAMRLEFNDGDETTRMIGAVVIRSNATGDVSVDFGPADGPPLVQIHMDAEQARQLATSIRNAIENGGETVLIVED